MPPLDWIIFGLFISSLTLYFAVRTKRSRQTIFLFQSVVGAVAGIYGFWTALNHSLNKEGETTFFGVLGFPLSAIIVISLSFAALTIEKVFSFSLLKQRVFPIVSLYLACWAALIIAMAWITVGHLTPLPLWHFLFFGILISAFVVSIISKFSVTSFQVFLPLLLLSFLVTLAESHLISTVIAGIDSVKASVEDGGSRFKDDFFKGGVWKLFLMFSYLFLNTRINKAQLKQNAFADKLPKAAVVLVLSSFVYEFPEFDVVRKLLPIEFSILSYGHLFLDLLIIPLFLLSSGWPYLRESVPLVFVVLGGFGCTAIAVSAAIGNPLSYNAEAVVLENGKQLFNEIASWNPERAGKAVGHDMDDPRTQKNYSLFHSDLGQFKEIAELRGEVYTYMTIFHGLTSNALVTATGVFERGNGKFYLRMAKDRSHPWEIRAVELYDSKGYHFRFDQRVKASVPGGGYRMVPLP